MRFVARIGGWIAGALAIPIGLGSGFGRLGAVFGVAIAILVTLWLWLWLPRAAHGAFEAGQFRNAHRRYRLLGAIAVSVERERAARLSRSACHIAAGRVADSEQLLEGFETEQLAAAERAVWLNNRACAALADGRDPHAALALVDEASALRPDVAAVQHTRGMALLAVGRVDDAIAVLDGMRAGGELSHRLERDRCRELARAWTQKGEPAYADDYRLRAEALKPS